MMFVRKWIVIVAAAVVPAWCVNAQTPSASTDTPPVAQPLGGPAISGVCLLAREAVFANAKVGQAATSRLQVLTREAQAELDAERAAIDTDVQAFQAQQVTLSADDRTQRQKALEARLQAVQAKASQRSREIDATRLKAIDRLAGEAQPVIAQVYQQHKCGLLIDRNSVLGGNMSNDLTALVVQGLDAKITTITFDRESLPLATASTTMK
jgi:Skp family chaperone for outer membrane proteins